MKKFEVSSIEKEPKSESMTHFGEKRIQMTLYHLFLKKIYRGPFGPWPEQEKTWKMRRITRTRGTCLSS